MVKKIMCSVLVLFLLLSSACGKKSSGSYNNSKIAPQIARSEINLTQSEVKDTANTTAKDNVQKIIQNYEISIEAEDLKKTAGQIESKVKETNGYLDNEQVTDYSCFLSARVPSNNLDNFIAYLEKNFKVNEKTKNSQNITDEYVDNDARLKNLKAEEIQMLDVLKKANSVEDILRVQSELYRIRGEIESLESKKKVWDKQVDYSTIRISMTKKQITSSKFVSVISGNEFIKTIFRGLANSFLYLVLALEKIVIFIASNIFLLIILTVVGLYGYKKYKKNNVNKNNIDNKDGQ